MQFSTSILPVIVLYKQKLENAKSLAVLNDYLKAMGAEMDLFVYDNSPEPMYENSITFGNFKVQYVHDKVNAGVSKAYNTGAAYGLTLKKSWLLLLDQDTVFPSNFPVIYEDAVNRNPDIPLFAPVLKTQHGDIMSPGIYRRKRVYWVKSVPEGKYSLQKYSPVNSGLLINLDAFQKAGGYNGAVRLDFADFQFIERLARHYNWFYTLDLVCEQDFSAYDTNPDKLRHRFAFFCEGARNCDRERVADSFWYLAWTIRRMGGLMLKNRDARYLQIFIQKYLLRK
ncbi:glycosyltransferase family protein [Chitinophaga silvisoli]|uniref:Glycosyltransferase n=1 Tax=Chitinophaga silvisoli TaxID=2291814 RepID=A0A3E1P6M8_9BACT|nr:hypothetical protein [Chitinophaga silvisoli]RFM35849.1 hypothetical protein DXN04_10815 [Chitinophaga silvisoli]